MTPRAAFLTAFVLVLFARFALAWLNARHQRREGHVVPAELAGHIDAAELARIAAYTRDKARLSAVRSAFSTLVLGAFLFGGLIAAYDVAISAMTDSFILEGVVFFAGLSIAGAVLELPFELYSDFRLEARHGFNRKSGAVFWGDWVKGTLLSLVLLAVLGSGVFWLVSAAPHTWWLWAFFLISGFTLLMTFISPYVIEPLFFKMTPLGVPELEQRVQELTERAGVEVGKILKVDASRRSSHSNAYFTGIGRVKRVVLFDTLLQQMTQPQILAVLAHELGHWKKHHVLSRMVAMQAMLLVVLYAGYRLVPADVVPALVGAPDASFAARALILFSVGSLALFPLTPLFSYWSRRHEWQADRFAVTLHGHAGDLADALMRLARENLSNLHPHPLYAAFYYSHPPVTERIRALRSASPAPAE